MKRWTVYLNRWIRIVFLATGILVLPAHAQLFSPSPKKEVELGAEIAQEVEQQLGLYTSAPEASAYLSAVGGKLAAVANDARWKFSFQILDQEEPNAFAIPGGAIYVSRGLLALVNSEDELAGVLAHEIAHVTERHSAKQQRKGFLPGLLSVPGNVVGMVNQGLGAIINTPVDLASGAWISHYSRTQEKEADGIGIQTVAKAGYNGDALADLLQRMERVVNSQNNQKRKSSIFDSHPMTETRLADIRSRAASLKRGPHQSFAPDKASLLGKVDGIWWEDNPEQGVFRRDSFVQPAVGFAMDLPEGWTNRNTPMYVISIAPTRNGVELISIADRPTDPEVLGKRFIAQMRKNSRIEPISAEKIVVDQFPGFVATYREKSGREDVYLDMTWVTMNTNSFQIMSYGPDKYRQTMHASVATLRPLNEPERGAVTAKRLRVVMSPGGENLSELGKRTANIWSEEFTGLVNDLKPDATLAQGQLIKIAREESWAARPNAP
jgi:predicted Zn-dependent protease